MKNAVLILLAFVALAAVAAASELFTVAGSVPARYRIEGYHEYLWRWTDELPYEIIRPVCWDESLGFGCDEGFAEEFGQGDIVNRIDDYSLEGLGYKGLVYRNGYGCWVWWWGYHHDSEHNPHPIGPGNWIVCPSGLVLEF